MDLRTFACPNCGKDHQFYLSRADARHLRRCPTCDRWFVATEVSEDSEVDRVEGVAYDVVGLDDPPTCPVDGCPASPSADELPAHVIAAHDGSLSPTAE